MKLPIVLVLAIIACRADKAPDVATAPPPPPARAIDASIDAGRIENPETLADVEQAIAYERTQTPLDRVRLAKLVGILASMRGELGDHAAALVLMDEHLALVSAHHGPDHVKVADASFYRATPLVALEQLDRAADSLRTAIAGYERANGRADNSLVRPLLMLASIELERSPAAAIPHVERATKIVEGSGSPPELLPAVYFVHAKAIFGASGDRKRAGERASKAAAMLAVLALQTGDQTLNADIAEIRDWATNVCKCAPKPRR